MENKVFSVVIATYNCGATIERAIKSVLIQKTDDVELIVVDGASKDNTLDVLNRYKNDIDFFVSEPDKGVYDAWNKALTKVRGEWIMFLGGDDYYSQGIFEKYKAFLASNYVSNVDIVSARCQLVNSHGAKLRVFGAPYLWEEFRNKNRLSHASVLHNNALFKELGNFNLQFNISADYEFLLRRKLNSLFMDEVVVYMQDGGMSYSSAGLIQTFKVKQYRKSSTLFWNVYYLIKGFTGFHLRRLIWSFNKKHGK